MTAARHALALLPMACLVGITASPPALGAGWDIGSRWRIGAEAEDAGRGPRTTAVLGASVGIERSTETASTRADAALNLRADEGAARRRSDGRLGLAQSLSFERGGFSAEAQIASEALADAALGTADVLLGRGDRRQRSASFGWNHRVSERLSANLAASRAENSYADTGAEASDFGEQAVTASMSYALDEHTRLTGLASRSSFRTDDGVNRSTTDSLRLSWSRDWSETASFTGSVGTWRNTREIGFDTLVCPLAVAFCESGVVAYTPVRRFASIGTSGSSYAVGLDRRLDERTGLVAKLSRDLQTGGAGVQRIDAASLALTHAFSPLLDSSFSVAVDRSSALDDRVSARRQRAVSFSLRRALTTDSSLSLSADRREGSADSFDTRLRSTRLSLTYESAGPGLNR